MVIVARDRDLMTAPPNSACTIAARKNSTIAPDQEVRVWAAVTAKTRGWRD